MSGNTVPKVPLIPELLVSDLDASLDFWCGPLGFRIRYERMDEGFARLERDGADVMLEQRDPGRRNWLTAELERPFGRGINFEIAIGKIDPVAAQLQAIGWPIFMQPEEKWYRAGNIEIGQRQFLVQDPDGYLLRLIEWIGERPSQNSRGGA